MNTSNAQPSILSEIPALARALFLSIVPERRPADALSRLRDVFALDWGAVGIGEPLAQALDASVAGLRTFPALSDVGVENPSTQHALWVRLHGDDRGLLFDRETEVLAALGDAFVMGDAIDTFRYMWRLSMPFVTPDGQGLEFVAYVESLDRFERMLRRMLGLDDGIVDGLFTFSRPVTGGYYWCPPVARGKLELRCLGL